MTPDRHPELGSTAPSSAAAACSGDRLLFDSGTGERIIAGRASRDNAPVPRVLVIDNYDSFVYNLVQYLGELGAEPVVHRHDAVTLDEMRALEPDAVLISPGPGPPERRRALERRDPRTSASAASRCSACASASSASASSTAARSCARRT